MRNRDRRCVFVTDDLGVADVVVTLLGHEGVEAQVMDRGTLGGLLGLTVWSKTGVSANGVEVWVSEVDDAPRARQLVEAMDQQKAKRRQVSEQLGPVDAACEECGAVTNFPANQRGTVQDCPHCGEYLDVPGGDEEETVDWGEPAEDD
ncbi:MAG: DUF2007 domain-containing protein [Pirellulaceae bacterium]